MSTGNRRTLEQEIADLKNKLARKEEARRKLADGQKIIIGGMMLALAERDDNARRRLAELLEKHVTRDADVRRIKPVIAQLKSQAETQAAEGNPPSSVSPQQAAAHAC